VTEVSEPRLEPIPAPIPALVIAGPTASGKTHAAMMLADRLNGEIVNADSMQVYKGMDIGTAKPTAEERLSAVFHLLDVASPADDYSVSLWREQALCALKQITERGRLPILCGGTGFYLRSLMRVMSLAEAGRSDAVRDELAAFKEQFGSEALHARLAAVDPQAAQRLHPNDVFRVTRALEVQIVTGVPLSEHHRRDRENSLRNADVHALTFVLNRDRQDLFERIDRRVDSMMSNGLVDEVKGLLASGYSSDLPAMKSLGYKEVCSYLQSSVTLEDATEEIKLNTRRYAKRQLTWFRGEPEARWIDLSTISLAGAVESIADQWSAYIP
jgi:tRNA dimethylallyltransferase